MRNILTFITIFSSNFSHIFTCTKLSGRPLNNHGVAPYVLISEEKEIEVTKGLLLALLPTLSAEWIVSMNIRLFRGLDTSFTFCRLFHMTKGGQNTVYGDRTPLILIRASDNVIQTNTAMNNIKSRSTLLTNNPVQINQTLSLEIHQRYIQNGNHRYFIIINGVEVHSEVNYSGQQFHDIKVYATSSGGNTVTACPAMLSDLKLTNFL
uniref:Uncharacterized protein n=1 Tax=Clytia hemisphaerica TaxID=252671 RepID=A0A7M5X675_9CNID